VTYARPGLLLVGQSFALVHTDDCATGAITAIPTDQATTAASTTATATAGAEHDHHKCNGYTDSATDTATAVDDTAAAAANTAAAASTYSNVCCGRCDAPLGVSMSTAKPADTSVDTSSQQPVTTTTAAATALATGEYTLYSTC
jgi:HECT-like Ubiquitin-conjugating enzyme (E2)-binding